MMSGRERKHVTRACDACRRRKTKCNGITPCPSCLTKGIDCRSTAAPDRRKTVTKEHVDMLYLEISHLKADNERLKALLPAASVHIHPTSHVNQNDHSFGISGSPSYHQPTAGSPTSLMSSLTGSTDGSLFLTVPSLTIFSSGTSPAPGFVLPADTNDMESNLVDEFSRLWISSGKHFVTAAADEELIAIAGSSPIALACTSPRSPSPLLLDPRTLDLSPAALNHFTATGSVDPSTGSPGAQGEGYAAPVVHKHDAFCACDWSRHIPEHIRYHLTREDHDGALQQYFTDTACHMLVIPDAFMRDMRRTLASYSAEGLRETHALHYSPALHCAVLADAGAFVQAPSLLAREDIREALARAARDLAEEECARNINIIPAVRALCVVARYYMRFSTGAPRAFGAFGTALRVALRSGLTLEPVATCSVEDRRTRAWCIASLMSQDVSISLHLGQEPSVPSDLIPVIAEQTMAIFKDDPELASFAHTTALAAIASRIATMYSRGRPGSGQDLMSFQTEMVAWHSNLPSSLVLSRGNAEHAPLRVLMLDMAYNRVLILLHRRFCAGTDALEGSQKIVHTASKQIFRDLGTFEREHGFACATFTIIQIIYAAGAAQLLRAGTLSPGAAKARAKVNGFVSQARDALQQIARTWPCAAEFARALDGRIPRPVTPSEPPIVSPQPVSFLPLGAYPIPTLSHAAAMWPGESGFAEAGNVASPWMLPESEGQI